MVVIKLKDILKESKFGHLVERPRKKGKKKRDKVVGKSTTRTRNPGESWRNS